MDKNGLDETNSNVNRCAGIDFSIADDFANFEAANAAIAGSHRRKLVIYNAENLWLAIHIFKIGKMVFGIVKKLNQ
jgi:hypothetical protein